MPKFLSPPQIRWHGQLRTDVLPTLATGRPLPMGCCMRLAPCVYRWLLGWALRSCCTWSFGAQLATGLRHGALYSAHRGSGVHLEVGAGCQPRHYQVLADRPWAWAQWSGLARHSWPGAVPFLSASGTGRRLSLLPFWQPCKRSLMISTMPQPSMGPVPGNG